MIVAATQTMWYHNTDLAIMHLAIFWRPFSSRLEVCYEEGQ